MGKNLNNDSDERIEPNPRLKVYSLFKRRNERIRPSISNLITFDEWDTLKIDLLHTEKELN